MNLARTIPNVTKTPAEKGLNKYLKSLYVQMEARFVGMPNTPETQALFDDEIRRLNEQLEYVVVRGQLN